MMKKYFLAICFTLPLFFLFAKNASAYSGEYKKIFEQAETYFSNENYPAALPLYMKLDSMDKGSANLNFKIGFCYLNAATYKTKSIPYFEEAIKNIARKYEESVMSEKGAPLSTYYYLAKAYHLHYEFDKAIEFYQKYITELGTDPKYKSEVDEINHDIETCNFGKELVKKPKTMVVTNLGEGVNSAYPEYSPVVSLDEQTLIFTTRRKGGSNVNTLPNGQYYEDIFSSSFIDDKWTKAIPLGSKINTTAHEATINLSADGQKLLIYKDKNGNGGIYESELNGNEWGEPQLIAAPVNSASWESHACYTSDNRIIYFISDRPGGYGGRDVYKCVKLPNGEWGPAQNLGDVINTKYDEDGVFIHPDGKQIFFSSKGHESMGGFDIFTSYIDDENGFWTTPVNYGYPVNTADDDVFLITTADGKRAFFSSDKEGGFGEKDIYMITFPENEPRDITILVGKIVNNSKEDITSSKIFITNVKTNDTLQILNANVSTGKFGTNLPVGNTYKTTYYVNGKEFYSEQIDVPKGQNYQVVRKEIPYNGNNSDSLNSNANANNANINAVICDPKSSDFKSNFEYNKKDIDSKSQEYTSFINALTQCIKANSKVIVQIESSASTVPTKTFRSNQNLAETRGKAAKSKLVKSLEKEGLKESQIQFLDLKSLVQGPEYQKDAIENKATYEQYQYIKIKVEIKK